MNDKVGVGGVVGTLRMDNGRGVVRVEDTYATDRATLWASLTEPERLARWIAHVTGDVAIGGLVNARFTSGWEGTLRVDECEPERRLLITSGVGDPDETHIEATLTAEGSRTRLVIEERGFPRDEVAAHGAGWHVHLDDFRIQLDGGESVDWEGRWHSLSTEYLERAAALPR